MKIKNSLLTSTAMLTLTLAPVVTTAVVSPVPAMAKTVAGKNVTVKPDHADLDKAIENAKKLGFDVEQSDAKIQKVDFDKVDQTSKDVTKSYADQVKAINDAIDKYNKDMDAYNKAVAEAEDSGMIITKKDGITFYGTTDQDKRGSLDFYSGLKVLIDTDVAGKDASLATAIGWSKDTKLENISMTSSGSSDDNYKYKDIKKGQQFKLTNVGKTESGKNLNILATISSDPKRIKSDGDRHGLGIKKGGTDGDFNFTGIGYDKYPIDFKFVDDNDKPVKITSAFAIGDIDYGQSVETTFGNIYMYNPWGSYLEIDRDKGTINSDNASMNDFLKDNDINGFNQTPIGTNVVVGLGDTFNYTHVKSTPSMIQWNLFGSATTLDSIEKPIKPKLTVQLTELQYKSADIDIKPTKDVETSVGGGTVKNIDLNQKFNYELGSSFYPADREEFNSWSIDDDYDQTHDKYNGEYEIHAITKDGKIDKTSDLEKFFTDNKDKAVTVDDKDGKLTINASKEMINFINANMKGKDIRFAVYPEFTRIKAGTVKNTFTETWNGEAEKSNTVTTTTAEEIKKLANTGIFNPWIGGLSALAAAAFGWLVFGVFSGKNKNNKETK